MRFLCWGRFITMPSCNIIFIYLICLRRYDACNKIICIWITEKLKALKRKNSTWFYPIPQKSSLVYMRVATKLFFPCEEDKQWLSLIFVHSFGNPTILLVLFSRIISWSRDRWNGGFWTSDKDLTITTN